MSWLWRLLFFGRIRRLKRIQHAAALLADGRPDEAEQLLALARPKVWVDDLAVFHFVTGKLRMEQGDLDQAEQHLHTALALGLERPTVKLNLAVLLVRKCQLLQALTLLDEVELDQDPAILEQARVMREVIRDARAGSQISAISSRSDRFRKKHLSTVDPAPATTLPALAERLRGKLSGSDRDDGCLLLGQLIVESCGGTWLVGLEPRDHQVLVGGLLYSPSAMISALIQGDVDRLSLPPA
ncbi:MAG: tetratricopeptide repeat protein [bacterium]